MIVSLISLLSAFGTKKKTKMTETLKKETFDPQPLLPNGCQPLKPLEQDTFTKSSEKPIEAAYQDTFTKKESKSPFVKTPELKNDTQEFLVLSSFQENKSVSFTGYKHALKTAWKNGQLPSVVRGLYGNKLTKANISLEHMTPVSQGGKTILENLALAEREANRARGVKPIAEVITYEQLVEYLEQFRNVRAKGINGNKYIKNMLEKAIKEWHFKPD